MIKTPSSIVLGGAGIFKKGMTQLGGVANLNLIIKQLFANLEQGFTQTLDDYSILFQDAAGTTSVTGAGQTLGLVLDKSKGLVLGSELKSAGALKLLGTAPTATYEPSTGIGTVNRVDISNQSFVLFSNAVGGKWFKVSISNTGASACSLRNVTNTAIDATLTTIASGTTFNGYVYVPIGFYLGIASSIGSANFTVNSIKELQGNHAAQSTSSYRPLLQNTPRRIQYDGIDDKLTTTLPAQLTGCTVIRAIPNVGCKILTNQTIPTPYNDSTSHCGLIVINRALTAYETSLVTQIFNKLAGV